MYECKRCIEFGLKQCRKCSFWFDRKLQQFLSTACTECQPGYTLSREFGVCGNADVRCLDSEYLVQDGSIGFCLPCLPGCGKCDSKTKCLQCSQPELQLRDGVCMRACPESMYLGKDQTCSSCGSHCAACDSVRCLRCSPGFMGGDDGISCIAPSCGARQMFKEGECVCSVPGEVINDKKECFKPGCGMSQYFDAISRKCASCMSLAGTCSSCTGKNPVDCTGCIDSQYLFEKQCLECPKECSKCRSSEVGLLLY